ncbi:MAG: ABC transporter permease [Gemmatimonadetes bacterium]|nr:ABC transporter permease [Gemmatimonadota bacterium]
MAQRRAAVLWVRLMSRLVPRDARQDWLEEWLGELAARGGSMAPAWGALADAWYLRTEGWTVDALMRDLRGAVKGFLRRPAFTVLAAVTLAIGIGCTTAIFSVIDGVLINPLPFPESDRLVSYNYEAPGLEVNIPLIPHSQEMYLHYLEEAEQLEAFTVFQNGNVNLVSGADPQQLPALFATQEYFDVLGVHPVMGRGFAVGKDRPGANAVVVLGNTLWSQTFGADPAIIGRTVEMDGVQRTVIGVMPPNALVLNEQVILPLEIDSENPDAGSLGLIGVGRLAQGATAESADAEMQGLLMRLVEEQTDEAASSFMEDAQLAADVKPLKEMLVQDIRQALWVLLGTVGFVLLIACANVANLFLVRAESRQREQAVRTAMGATRGDVIRQYLTESVVLATLGGALGLALAAFGVRGLLALAPADLPGIVNIGIDGSVLAFTAVISVVAGLAFGMFPALGYGRKGVSGTLREGGRSATDGRERHRARSGLVIAQVALALVLLVGSGLSLRSFVALRSVDLGFAPERVMTFRYTLPRAEYGSHEEVRDFHRMLTERLAAMPGAQHVGMISGLPLTDSKSATPMEAVDNPYPPDQLAPMVETREATPGYFETMGIDIVEGRALEWTDQANEFRGVVVSRALARGYWPERSALGQLIRAQGDTLAWQVVGVAEDVRFDAVADEPLPMIYRPIVLGAPSAPVAVNSVDAVVRVAGNPMDAITLARDVLSGLDPRLPMISPNSLQEVVNRSMMTTSFTVLLLGIAAGIALLLGTVGIYGVISFIVSRKTQEIGVRIALGAPASAVLKEVVGQGMRLALVGVFLGLAGAWVLSRAMESLLYGVPATDPWTFGSTAAFLALIALTATWVPARRAAQIDPMEALRAE